MKVTLVLLPVLRLPCKMKSWLLGPTVFVPVWISEYPVIQAFLGQFKRSVSYSRSAASDSLQPCKLEPTRLLRPWDSPGKNSGVGCHFLLQGNLPNWEIKPGSPALQADALPSKPPGKPCWAVELGDIWTRSWLAEGYSLSKLFQEWT